jgi:hypothetical protein
MDRDALVVNVYQLIDNTMIVDLQQKYEIPSSKNAWIYDIISLTHARH